jgi:hypothetical protein
MLLLGYVTYRLYALGGHSLWLSLFQKEKAFGKMYTKAPLHDTLED